MIWGFASAALATAVLVPVVLRALRSTNIMDTPNDRSGHTIPTPRGGGVACGIAAAIAAFVAQGHGQVNIPWGGLGIVGVIAFLGFVDDVIDLSATLRLVIQMLAGAVIGFWFGNWPYVVVGIIVLTWLVNVTNFMDGINGLTAGISILWGVTAWWSGMHYSVVGLALVGALCAGVGVGFLPWNFPKARIFIGDSGAYLLGALYATGILISLQRVLFNEVAVITGNQQLRATAIAVAPLAIYLADTTWTILRRILRGDNPMEAHREYTFHRLVDTQGWPHWVMTTIIVVLSGVVTLAVISMPDVYAILTAIGTILLYLSLPGMLADNARRHERKEERRREREARRQHQR